MFKRLLEQWIVPIIFAIAGIGGQLAVFQSPAREKLPDGYNLDRKNVVQNYLMAGNYRNGRPYSIIIDDDVLITREAVELMVDGIKEFDLVTVPVEKHFPTQHACLIVRHEILDRYPVQHFNPGFCNQCVWIGQLEKNQGARIKVLKFPILKTIKRQLLKKV